MPFSPSVELALKELRRGLEQRFGERLLELVLFGSHARAGELFSNFTGLLRQRGIIP
jgi:hypothetical protein